VITGEGRDNVGVLILPNRGAIAAQGWEGTEAEGILQCAPLAAEITARMRAHAARATGSAARVVSGLILSEPPSMAQGEATAKGNINFPKFLLRRADLVGRLYDENCPDRLEFLH
jgi:feruloyl-CoA synthase